MVYSVRTLREPARLMLINASLLAMFTKNYARSCYADDGGVFLEGVVSEATA